MEDQFFGVVEDHVAEAGKGPAVGGGSAEQLGGRHGGGWEGALVDEKKPQRDEEEEGVEPGYLSEPGGPSS